MTQREKLEELLSVNKVNEMCGAKIERLLFANIQTALIEQVVIILPCSK